MKKTLLITSCIVMLIITMIIGSIAYIVNKPEYALKKMIDDVNTSGMDGLYPHLTSKARTIIDGVSSITDNNIFNIFTGFVNRSKYVEVLKSEIQDVKWSISDVLTSNENAKIILSFDYDDKLIGSIEVSMVREDGKWKINGLNSPKFNKINWYGLWSKMRYQ